MTPRQLPRLHSPAANHGNPGQPGPVQFGHLEVLGRPHDREEDRNDDGGRFPDLADENAALRHENLLLKAKLERYRAKFGELQ